MGTVEIEPTGSGAVNARLLGEIDMSNADVITTELLGAVRAQQDFLLDLRQLTFLDSGGVRMLNVLAARLGEHGRQLEILIEPASPVSALLRIAPVRNTVVTSS